MQFVPPLTTTSCRKHPSRRLSIRSLERRLASILAQAFDDCPTLRGRFRLLECFSDLVHRPAIAEELERKHALMVEDFASEVAVVMQVSRSFSLFLCASDPERPEPSKLQTELPCPCLMRALDLFESVCGCIRREGRCGPV